MLSARSRSGLFVIFLTLILSGAALSGCVNAYKRSIGSDTSQVFERIFLTDFNTAWQAVLDSLKTVSLDVTNREGGLIQTRWTDNTAQKNFVESFANADSFLKAQYRVRVTVAKGFFNGKPSVKVSIQKDQLIQRDVLEGWRPIETDTVDENTFLYRVGRLIHMRMKIAKLEEDKIQKSLQENTPF